MVNTVCVNKKKKNIKLDKSDAVSYSLQNNYWYAKNTKNALGGVWPLLTLLKKITSSAHLFCRIFYYVGAGSSLKRHSHRCKMLWNKQPQENLNRSHQPQSHS